ncbi:DUF2878 domain-containing protein [Pseudomonas tohonis]|uniref:DUF2878 domain-containing protein n=1 Tax=Pseudomonas tohonis TaxID=2725477 RepID=UPI00255BA57E|nr:DUF2878 domain-containing protein [Pseudomonas tohonis]
MPRRLANAVLFQAGWFACLFAADQPLLLLVAPAILALHFLCIGSWAEDGRVVIAVALLGSLLDCLLLNLGLFDFGHDGRLIPPWLALLWALLGTTLNHCLAWTARPVWLAALLGAIAGPLSYLAGARLAGVGLPFGTLPSLLVLALIWAALLPSLHQLARRLRRPAPGN